MKLSAFLLAPLLGLAACQPMADAAPGSTIALNSLVGEYRVAGIDGAEVELPHAITLSIGADDVRYTSQCINGRWTYAVDGDEATTTRQPVASCRRALLPQEQAIDAVFEAGPTATRTATNGITFAGGGHTVTVFSQ